MILTCTGYDFWDNIFFKSQVPPIHIIYEELRNNLYQTISNVTHNINEQVQISPDQVISASKSGLRKLPISKKPEFAEKFKKFLS